MPVIISLILIGLALFIILMIIIRKFPALAILDVSNIPGEKEAKFKKQIMAERVDRDLMRWMGFLGRLLLSVQKHLSALLRSWQENLKKNKIAHQTTAKISWPEKQKRLKELFLAAEDFLKKEVFDRAEENLVKIISLDQKNLAAFFQLGNLYATQKKWAEARETYGYALKLARQFQNDSEILGDLTRQEIFFSLAEMEKDSGNLEVALENIQEALDLEPNNPRYLDLILDLSIMRKDRSAAKEYWQKLTAVNPDNQKLQEWRKKIGQLKTNKPL